MRNFLLAIALPLLLCGCQADATRSATTQTAITSDGGMVIGTMSYAPGPAVPSHALVKLTRLAPRTLPAQGYLLDAAFDPRVSHAVFAGSLPSGVYVVEEALSSDARFVPGTLRMPFEIQQGQVTDAGNFPMEQRAVLMRATLAE